MNAREFEKCVEFKRIDRPDCFGSTVIAKFEIRREVFIAEEMTNLHLPDVMLRVKKDLLLRLMRDVYENRQKEMIESTAELLVASPYGTELIEARNKVVQAALRQPDATIETLMRMYKDEILQPTKPE